MRTGRVPAQVGDGGSSTAPHPHFPLMDGPDPHTARGVPFHRRGVGVPGSGETSTVSGGPSNG